MAFAREIRVLLEGQPERMRRSPQTRGYEFEFAKPTEVDTLPGEVWKDVIFFEAAEVEIGMYMHLIEQKGSHAV